MSSQNILPIKKAALKMREAVPTQQIGRISIPAGLQIATNESGSGYDEIVMPHWNYFVDELKNGGYANLVKLFERLLGMEDSLNKSATRKQQEVNSYQALMYVVQAEANMNGVGTTLWDSIGNGFYSKKLNGWIWSLQKKGGSGISYTLSASKAFLASFSAIEFPSHLLVMQGKNTWQELIERFSKALSRSQDSLDKVYDKVDLLTFRIDILERVLWEYEAYGYAPGYDEKSFSQETEELSESVAEFSNALAIAQDGLEYYEQNPSQYKNRYTLLSDLAVKNKYKSVRGLQKLLTDHNLYLTKGKGRSSLESEYFHEMLEIWRKAVQKN